MKLSIIIPVYNVAPYLEKCLDSCLAQHLTAEEYEIICINDGSTDNSLEILERYAKQHPDKIKVLSQENQGLGASRNNGLKIAKGEYIYFVDSDDWIEEYSLDKITTKGEEVLMFSHGYSEKGNCQQIVNSNWILTDEVCSLSNNFLNTGAPTYWFRRLFLIENNLIYNPRMYYEDVEYTPRVMHKVNTFREISIPIYHYRIRAGSITQTMSTKHLDDLLVVAKHLHTYIMEQDIVGTIWERFFNQYMFSTIHTFLHNSIKLPHKERKFYFSELKIEDTILDYLYSKATAFLKIKLLLLRNKQYKCLFTLLNLENKLRNKQQDEQ